MIRTRQPTTDAQTTDPECRAAEFRGSKSERLSSVRLLSARLLSARLLSARLLSVVFLALIVAGCGRKAAPRPPEDVAPAAITDLSATDTPEGITLSWSRPKAYIDGSRMNDLGGFIIERAAGSDAAATFATLGKVAVSDHERFQQQRRFRLTDPTTIVGAPYLYRVVSFTIDEYVSAPSNVVAVERKSVTEETHAPLPAPQR